LSGQAGGRIGGLNSIWDEPRIEEGWPVVNQGAETLANLRKKKFRCFSFPSGTGPLTKLVQKLPAGSDRKPRTKVVSFELAVWLARKRFWEYLLPLVGGTWQVSAVRRAYFFNSGRMELEVPKKTC